MEGITVELVRLGQKRVAYDFAEGTTVSQLKAALTKDGVELAGFNIRIDGEAVSDTTRLNDGDVITLAPAVKGG